MRTLVFVPSVRVFLIRRFIERLTAAAVWAE